MLKRRLIFTFLVENGRFMLSRNFSLQAAGEMPHFPIIALTAHAMVSDAQASLAAGLDEHLTKPVQMDTLRSTLGRWLN